MIVDLPAPDTPAKAPLTCSPNAAAGQEDVHSVSPLSAHREHVIAGGPVDPAQLVRPGRIQIGLVDDHDRFDSVILRDHRQFVRR